jgi:hypothetical protein
LLLLQTLDGVSEGLRLGPHGGELLQLLLELTHGQVALPGELRQPLRMFAIGSSVRLVALTRLGQHPLAVDGPLDLGVL